MVDVSGGFGTDSDTGGGWGGGGDNYSGGWEAQVREGYTPDVGGSWGRGGGGYESNIANALSRLSVTEQERLFRDVIDPLMSATYNPVTDVGGRIAGYALNAMLSAMVPGLGTIAGATGLTKQATDWLRDNTVTQELQSMLGINGQQYNTGIDVIQAARNSGKSEQEIANAYNTVSSKRGGAMGLWEDITGESAARAATGAAGTAASYQQQALDYLKQMGAMPIAAQQQLGQVYGVTGTPEEQTAAIGGLRQSPLYQAIMGGREAGEEAIMRQAGATGGLRSGNIQDALARYSGDLERQALLTGLQGVQGLAGMGTYTPQIAAGMTGLGSTLAAGQTAAAQAEQIGTGQMLGLGGTIYKGLGGLGGITGGIGKIYGGYQSGGLEGALSAIGDWF